MASITVMKNIYFTTVQNYYVELTATRGHLGDTETYIIRLLMDGVL